MSLKISMDIDGVLADFYNPYLLRFGVPKRDSDITKNVQNILINDKEFWLNLPVLNHLEFQPRQYTTARVICKSWIKEYLNKELFPKAPIYQIHGYGFSKYSKIKMGGCHVHIDDSLSVFMDLNKKGMPCLLLDSPSNQEWNEPVGRIYSLDIDEIENTYYLFKDTIFPYFKDFIKLMITNKFHGIIICYNKNKPVGYIIYNNKWNFTDTITYKDDISDDKLSDLIECLKSLMIITNIKIIKFSR